MNEYERWRICNPELGRLEELEELGGLRQLTSVEKAELEDLYNWRDEFYDRGDYYGK